MINKTEVTGITESNMRTNETAGEKDQSMKHWEPGSK